MPDVDSRFFTVSSLEGISGFALVADEHDAEADDEARVAFDVGLCSADGSSVLRGCKSSHRERDEPSKSVDMSSYKNEMDTRLTIIIAC